MRRVSQQLNCELKIAPLILFCKYYKNNFYQVAKNNTEMRPSKSALDLELPSLKKKFKDKKFAAGCSRDTISKGAELLGMELDELLSETLQAMQSFEREVGSA